MKKTLQTKEYKTPQFQFVRQDEQNKVFYAASSVPEPISAGGSISTASQTTFSSW